MISLPCSHCQKTLEVDEAFAGGVCRCQHCGTIQTVHAGHDIDGNVTAGGDILTVSADHSIFGDVHAGGLIQG